jgi:putative mycofactocin binding protein MftB
VSTETRYAIYPHVRARKEAFGILFYNAEDSQLTFVKSGNLLKIEALPNGTKIISARLESQPKMKKLVGQLLAKRLICES